MWSILFLTIVAGANAESTSIRANPIRKVVTLMQNMQKEIEAEGAKEKELFEKFMCYCSGGKGTLEKGIADATAQIEELSAKLKSEEAEKVQIAQDLIGHKKDRESAGSDIEEATVLRKKENTEYTAMKADSETNIAAMSKAIPALEKGMAGAALLQMPGGNYLRNLIDTYPKMDPMDRRTAQAFFQESNGAEDTTMGAGEIVGILKAMKDEMEADLKDAIADEEKSVAGFNDLKASKEKEIEMATEAIESKMARAGELAVSVVQTKDALEDAEEEVADTQKFMATLEKECATKEKEMAERSKMRSMEISAISEAIGILNDDDALDVFKKAIPSALVQSAGVGFLQRSNKRASRSHKAQAILASTAATTQDIRIKMILYTLNSKLKLKSKTAKFDEVKKMIDDMVVLLGKQQKEDEKQKAYCEDEFEKSADEEAATKTKLEQVDAALAEATDSIVTLAEEINTLKTGINALDESTAEATEQRKEEHATYVEQMQMNEAALGLVEKAKNRMQKFYNPTLYKAPPKKEMSMEDKIMQAGSFAQVKSDVAPPPAPEMPSGPVKKNEKSAGVIGMMDEIIRDLENDMKDMEYEEKTAQKDYAELMADSQATRAGDTKAMTGKETSKAEIESKLMSDKEIRAATATDLKQIGTVIQELHAACDFIMENFDLRKEARTNEIEGLKNAKAVLSGASFSF